MKIKEMDELCGACFVNFFVNHLERLKDLVSSRARGYHRYLALCSSASEYVYPEVVFWH